MPFRDMQLRRAKTYRTLTLEWNSDRPRIIVGLTGLDRPSLQWHLTLWYRRHRA
jgi:hypothetical protein